MILEIGKWPGSDRDIWDDPFICELIQNNVFCKYPAQGVVLEYLQGLFLTKKNDFNMDSFEEIHPQSFNIIQEYYLHTFNAEVITDLMFENLEDLAKAGVST